MATDIRTVKKQGVNLIARGLLLGVAGGIFLGRNFPGDNGMLIVLACVILSLVLAVYYPHEKNESEDQG